MLKLPSVLVCTLLISPIAAEESKPSSLVFTHAVFSVAATKCEGNFAPFRDFARIMITKTNQEIDVKSINDIELYARNNLIGFCELATQMKDDVQERMENFVKENKSKKKR